MVSENVENDIKILKKLDLSKFPYDIARDIINSIGKLGGILVTLDPKTILCRARVNEDGKKYYSKCQLTYKPQQLNTTYQRARDVRPRQLIDYNTSEQAKLVWLRQSVESILKTDVYVKESTSQFFNSPAEY